jgi:dTDP-6-deoxy-L-talose 4-dehydrogenase (NAD+)
MGLNQFDFIDYDNFCDQVAYAILQTDINGIINICSGRPEKLSDRVERFIKDERYNISLNFGAFPDRPYDSKAIWGDDKKIQEILRRRQQEDRQ